MDALPDDRRLIFFSTHDHESENDILLGSPLKVLSTPQSSTQGHTSVRQHLLIWHEGCTIILQCSKKEGIQLAADDS